MLRFLIPSYVLGVEVLILGDCEGSGTRLMIAVGLDGGQPVVTRSGKFAGPVLAGRCVQVH